MDGSTGTDVESSALIFNIPDHNVLIHESENEAPEPALTTSGNFIVLNHSEHCSHEIYNYRACRQYSVAVWEVTLPRHWSSQ